MPQYRSRTSTHGRNMAGARALWRATGMQDGDFGKPIIAIANSFTQFVPGHVHLKDLGQMVAREIEAAGGIAKEFNTIAVDDGIAMGHGGMLYSLPSRDLIADSVEYMVNAHCADAMVCISNCDKITPGMLMAAVRLNIPTIFVSGGPMEAGKVQIRGGEQAIDLVDDRTDFCRCCVAQGQDDFMDPEPRCSLWQSGEITKNRNPQDLISAFVRIFIEHHNRNTNLAMTLDFSDNFAAQFTCADDHETLDDWYRNQGFHRYQAAAGNP